MAAYVDSSFLLAIILGQADADACSILWTGEHIRVSSILMKMECIVSLRRVALQCGFAADQGWVASRLDGLEPFFQQVSFKTVDDSIENMIRCDPRLAECRTLDAVHLATALYFQPHLDEPLWIWTFDRRRRELCPGLGLVPRP